MTTPSLPSPLTSLLSRLGGTTALTAALLLSAPHAAAADGRQELTHEVRSGQYLVLIAKRYHTTAEAIRKHNGLKRDQTLRPGMTLQIIETEEHRKWRAFLAEREERKRRAKEKAEEARQAKRRAQEARRERQRAERARQEQQRREKALAAKRRAEDAQRARRRAAQARLAEQQAREARKQRALAAKRERALAEKARAEKAPDEANKRPPVAARSTAENTPKGRVDAVPAPAALPNQGRAAPRRGTPAKRSPAGQAARASATTSTAGLVTFRRHRQTLRSQLVVEGVLVEDEAHRVDRLLRSLHTGETKPFDRGLLRHLATLSDRFGGRTLVIISGYRPGGEEPSRHQLGHAVDLRVEGVDARELFEQCKTLPGTGCGFYPRSSFVHIDTRPQARSWIDAAAPGEAPRFVDAWPPPPTR